MRYASTAITATFPTLFLGFAAASQIVALYIYLGYKPDWFVTSLCFVITTGTYLLNRIYDKEDKFNNTLRWNYFNSTKSKTLLWIVASIGALIIPVFSLIILKKYNIALLFGIISSIAFVYTVKIIPFISNKRTRWISLKEIPIGKNIIVSLLWGGGAVVISSSLLNVNLIRNDLLLLFLCFFIGNCNSTITSDARDIAGDRLRNVVTLPCIIGLKKTYILLTTVNLSSIIIITVLAGSGSISLKLAIFATLLVLWAGLSTIPQYFAPKMLSKTFGELLIDSHLFLSGAGLIVLSFLY